MNDKNQLEKLHHKIGYRETVTNASIKQLSSLDYTHTHEELYQAIKDTIKILEKMI